MGAEKLLVRAGKAGRYKSVVMGWIPSKVAKKTTTSPEGIGTFIAVGWLANFVAKGGGESIRSRLAEQDQN